jgi:hypothetical protein
MPQAPTLGSGTARKPRPHSRPQLGLRHYLKLTETAQAGSEMPSRVIEDEPG